MRWNGCFPAVGLVLASAGRAVLGGPVVSGSYPSGKSGQIPLANVKVIPNAASPGARDESLNKWQKDADNIVAQGYPGMIAAIDVPWGTYAVKGGYRNLDYGTAMRTNVGFRIGSFTKPFVAVVALQLIGEGKMMLDDPVEKWLPGLLKGNFDGNKITVRHLLQHTSGLPEYTDHLPLLNGKSFQKNRFKSWTPSQLVELSTKNQPRFPPGTGWGYTNTGYIVAGMIIDRVTGNSWRDEVRERIIYPLALTRTTVPGEEVHLPWPFISGYDAFRDSSGQQNEYVDVTSLSPSCAGAAGEIISTVEDGNTFLKALINGELLDPAQLREMQTTVPAPALHPVLPGARYGLGIMRVNSDCGSYWTHNGAIWGYQTRNGITGDGTRSIVLVVNSLQHIQNASAPSQGGPDLATRIINDVLCEK